MPSLMIGGSRIEYFEAGDGEPVLLLHSSASSGAQWRALAGELSGRYRVIVPDLYGYGASAHWPGHGCFHLGREADIVRALVDGPAHLVGHSYGGAVALHLAATHSVRSLTLIEPVAFHLLRGRDLRALAEISEVADAVTRALACGDYAGGMQRFVDYWSGPGAWAALPEEKRATLAPRLAKVALDFHATLTEPERFVHLKALPAPTLLIQGACAPLPTRRICELLAEILPNVRLETIAGAGHLCPLTHRDVVNDLIAAHLDSNVLSPLTRRTSCKPCSRLQQASATPNASRSPSACAGTSTAM